MVDVSFPGVQPLTPGQQTIVKPWQPGWYGLRVQPSARNDLAKARFPPGRHACSIIPSWSP